MNTKSQSQEIREMIEGLDFGLAPECEPIRDVLNAMNRRMDEIESASDRANHVASCLANGIQPD